MQYYVYNLVRVNRMIYHEIREQAGKGKGQWAQYQPTAHNNFRVPFMFPFFFFLMCCFCCICISCLFSTLRNSI